MGEDNDVNVLFKPQFAKRCDFIKSHNAGALTAGIEEQVEVKKLHAIGIREDDEYDLKTTEYYDSSTAELGDVVFAFHLYQPLDILTGTPESEEIAYTCPRLMDDFCKRFELVEDRNGDKVTNGLDLPTLKKRG